MPTYYTLKDSVPILPGQTLGFTSGKGYYAAGTPTPSQATKNTGAAPIGAQQPVATPAHTQPVSANAGQVARNTTADPAADQAAAAAQKQPVSANAAQVARQTSAAAPGIDQPVGTRVQTQPIPARAVVQSATGNLHPVQPATIGTPIPSANGGLAGRYLTGAQASLPAPKPNRFRSDWGTSKLAAALHLTPDENYIIFHESTWRPTAQNGQFFGLGQLSIDARTQYLGKNANTTDPLLQLHAMREYIRDRYGTEDAAVAHEMRYHWY